jgi:hypothetical protein
MANIYFLAAALRRLSEALYLTRFEPPIVALWVKLNDTVLAYEETPLLMMPAVLFVIVTPSSMTVHPALLKDMAPPWIAA